MSDDLIRAMNAADAFLSKTPPDRMWVPVNGRECRNLLERLTHAVHCHVHPSPAPDEIDALPSDLGGVFAPVLGGEG